MDRHLLLLIAAILLPLYGFCAQTFTEGIFTYEVNENDPGTVTIIDIDCTENDDVCTKELVTLGSTTYIVSSIKLNNEKDIVCSNLTLSNNIENIENVSHLIVRFNFALRNSDISHFRTDNYSLFTKDSKLIRVASENPHIIFYPTCKSIGEGAFRKCNKSYIEIPETIMEIEKGAFSDSYLESITLPGSIKTIPEDCFSNCHSLKKITISEGCEQIDFHAFYNVSELNTVILPESLKTLDISAFCTETPNNTKILIKNSFNNKLSIVGDEKCNPKLSIPLYYIPIYFNKYFLDTTLYDRMYEILDSNNIRYYYVGDYYYYSNYTDIIPVGIDSHDCYFILNYGPNISGFQFDVILPEGVEIGHIYINNSDIEYYCVKLKNNDWRVLAYAIDGNEMEQGYIQFHFVSDVGFHQGDVKIHNHVNSICGSEVVIPDFTPCYFQGFDIYNYNDIFPESIYEYDTFNLPNPFHGFDENVKQPMYVWESDDMEVKINGDQVKVTEPGIYYIRLRYKTADEMDNHINYIGYYIHVLPANWGDADGNGSVNINDVAMLVNYILGDEPEGFNIKLADVDRNGRINVVDITETLKLVLSAVAPSDRAPQRRINAKFEADTDVFAATPDPNPNAFLIMTGEEVSSDEYRLSIRLDADQTLVGIQTDLSIPEGMTIKSIKAGAAAADHILQSREIATGVTRVVLFSFSNSEITNGGNILEVTLSGSPVDKGVFNLTNTVGSTTDVKELFFNDSSFSMQTVGVYGISTEDSDCEWYDLTGRRVMNPEKGVYIRVCKGKSKKVIL